MAVFSQAGKLIVTYFKISKIRDLLLKSESSNLTGLLPLNYFEFLLRCFAANI